MRKNEIAHQAGERAEDAQKGPFAKQGDNQTVTISPKAKTKTKTGGSKVK